MSGNADDVGTSHPQEDSEKASKEIRDANTPALGQESGRAGGKSAASDGGTGGPGHG